ncbi:hypothetical protein DSO57_1008104 [Entomophthora muscae]|uniref:Uncharacterized protein n=1 Tax=Entomophthora muscae TaxID=34485 RepID=A0ACC2RYC5_9FUNG|nr:hypothetical protein DSO57_1008104 [Entomophthora muscae]
MTTEKNSEMTPTEKNHLPSLPSPPVTRPKSIYRLKSNTIKKSMKTVELRMSQGLPLDDSFFINHWFSEIESQERMKHNCKLAPAKSVDSSVKSRPDSATENKKTDDPYSVMNTSVSTIQHLSHMPVSSHNQGYTTLLSASKEHKNNGSPDEVDDVHTRPHQPERIPVEFKTENSSKDSGSRARTSEKLQPQEYKSKKPPL